MSELNNRVLLFLILPVWFLALLTVAIVSGVALLAFVGVTIALCKWLWSMSRPRAVASGVFVGRYYGQEFYMEVA